MNMNLKPRSRAWKRQSPDSELRGKIERFLKGPDSSGMFHFPSQADIETQVDMDPIE